MRFLRLARVAIPACLVCCSFAKEPITQTDMLKMRRVTEVQIAPDGSFAVYSVQEIHTDPPTSSQGDPVYSYRTHIWFIDLRDSSAKPVQLTFGERSESNLAISPNGRELAFIRLEDKKEKPKPQAWVLPLQSPGEACMVTSLEFGASFPRWRPDGRALLVASSIPISKLPGKPAFDQERPARSWWDFDRPVSSGSKIDSRPDGDWHSIRNWLEHNAAHGDPVDITRIAFLGEQALTGEMAIVELFRVDLDPEPRTTQLTTSSLDHEQAIYVPQGDRILFVSRPDPKTHPDRVDRYAIWQMNADGSNERTLVSDEQYSFSEPHLTADGKRLVLIGEQKDEPTYRQGRLAVFDFGNLQLNWLTKDGDPGVQLPTIGSDGNVYYTIDYQGGQPLRRVSLNGKQSQDLISGPVGVNAFGVAAGKIVYAQIAAGNPNELYVKGAAASAAPRCLTQLNAAWLEDKALSLPEGHWITRPDGTRVQYWVMKPANAVAGEKYPWVLDMHGGPSAMWGPGEYSMWHEFQIFCSFGYGIVYANPRGSGGYGYAFQRANYKDWGNGPMGDVMAALDDAIASYPMIDPDRLFVTGGSYAGYLTAWIVGHTDRFKAAAALRGVYDLSTFFGEGNAYRLVPTEFGGYPWEPETRQLLDQESPISYVRNIKTPLLIIHGSQDNRTGVAQSQMLFRALKQLNRPVEYARYPNIGHELTRSGPPGQRMDHMLRIIEFFHRYAANNQPAPQGQATRLDQ